MANNIHISYHDNINQQPIVIECITEGESVELNNGPYYRLKFGEQMTIFLEPKRLWDLGLAISQAPLPERVAMQKAMENRATEVA